MPSQQAATVFFIVMRSDTSNLSLKLLIQPPPHPLLKVKKKNYSHTGIGLQSFPWLRGKRMMKQNVCGWIENFSNGWKESKKYNNILWFTSHSILAVVPIKTNLGRHDTRDNPTYRHISNIHCILPKCESKYINDRANREQNWQETRCFHAHHFHFEMKGRTVEKK